MLVRFVQFFARRARATLVAWVLIVLAGAAAYTTLLPREGFPAVDVPIAVASGAYFADDPEAVDAEVLAPIRESLGQPDGVEQVQTFARDNSFSVLVELEQSRSSEDGVVLLQEAVAGADLPDGLEVDYTVVDAASFFGEYDLLVAVTAPIGTLAGELDAVGARVAAELQADGDIDLAEAITLEEEAVDPVTGDTAVRQTIFNRYAAAGGADVAFSSAVTVGVVAADGVDSLEIESATAGVLAELRASGELPEGWDAVVAADFATQIRSQISSLQTNVATGIAAVVLVTLVLIGWRASVVTALFVASVMATVMLTLYLVGISLNTISLFGVILVVGLFVDDAIVIVEAIDSFREKGRSAVESIGTAIRRVGSASVAGTLTTVLVFAPLLFISGILGDFVRQLPTTVIISLVISLVLSLIVIPVFAKYLVLRADRFHGPVQRAEAAIARRVSQLPGLLGRENKWPGRGVAALGVLLAVGLFMAGGVLAGRAGFDIFPVQDDSDQIFAEIDFEPGTTLAEAEAITDELDSLVVAELGDLLDAAYVYSGDEQSALINYDLVPFGTRSETSSEMVERLEPLVAEIDGGRITLQQASNGPPREEFPFQAQIVGEDLDLTLPLATDIADFLRGRELTKADGESFVVTDAFVALADVVARTNGERQIEVRAGFDDDDVTSLLDATERAVADEFGPDELAARGLPAETIQFDFGLESDNQDSFDSVGTAFLIAIALIFLVLVLQFRSLLQPLLVLLALPFGIFGVFLALVLTGNPISFFVFIGITGLVGIAVNNTILLLDFANQERRAGADRVTAIETAVRRRFRPLVSTSLTTVAGLLPLAISDPFWQPLAVTIMGGLLSSTFLVILSFPYFYLFVEWLRDWFARVNPLSGQNRRARRRGTTDSGQDGLDQVGAGLGEGVPEGVGQA